MSAVHEPDEGYAERNAFLYLVLGLISLSRSVLKGASDLAPASAEVGVEAAPEDPIDDLLR